MTLCGVVLGAGLSTRMGGFPKPLLHIGDKRFVERILSDLEGADVEDRVVVLGHEREEVRSRADFDGATVVDNPNYREGMLSSVKVGVREARRVGADGLLLWPTDFPVAGNEVVGRLREARRDRPDADVVIPAVDGDRGHPALFADSTFDALLAAPTDEGARAVVYDESTEVVDVPVESERVLVDVDTPEEYWDAVKRYT